METWGSVIITDNAIRKMAYYGIGRYGLIEAFNKPDREEWSPVPGCKSYIKNYKDYEIGVIARQKEDGTWLIVSCWCRNFYL